MASLDFLNVRSLAAQNTVGRVVDDTPVAIRISHPGAEAVTSVTIVTATSLALVDADGTSTLAFATYTTVALLADAINALDNWECKVLDGLRTDATASKFVDGAITSSSLNGETIWDVKVDTSGLDSMTYRCTYDRNVSETKPKGSHRVKLQEISYNVDVSAGAANGVRIYEWDAANKTETQIWQALSVDATVTTINFASGNGMITSGDGNDLIVRVIDGTSITDSANNFLQCCYIRE